MEDLKKYTLLIHAINFKLSLIKFGYFLDTKYKVGRHANKMLNRASCWFPNIEVTWGGGTSQLCQIFKRPAPFVLNENKEKLVHAQQISFSQLSLGFGRKVILFSCERAPRQVSKFSRQ